MPIIRQRVLLLLVVVLSWTLASCGFHLRGPVTLAPPLKKMYIQSPDPYSQLTRNLKQYLKLSGVQFASTPMEATTVLDILHERTGEQLLSVGGTQQTRQYNLTLTVSFQVTDPQGKVLIEPVTLSETQAITIRANQILGGSNEADNLYQQMRRDIVYSIMNSLASKNVTAILMGTPVE